MLENGAMSGAFFETYVVSEMIKNLYSHNLDPNWYLYYYRDIDQKEIDLIFVKGNTIYPIEIKKSDSPKKPSKNFGVLKKYKQEIGKGIVIDTCEKIRPISEESYAYPAYLLGM